MQRAFLSACAVMCMYTKSLPGISTVALVIAMDAAKAVICVMILCGFMCNHGVPTFSQN